MVDVLVKRKDCWIMTPQSYEISCDLCGGHNIAWSEFEHHIWCYDCEKDTPGNGGIFNGPIPVNVCRQMGISFDKVELATGRRLYFQEFNKKVGWGYEPQGK